MTLISLFTEENIIFQICRIRAKLSKQRSKLHIIHQLSNDSTYNYHTNNPKNSIKLDSELLFLGKITPPRRQWVKLRKVNRYKNGQRLNNIDINTLSLIKTINYFRKFKPAEPFVVELNSFLADVIDSVTNPNYKIERPKIIPKLKEKIKKSENKCRPISLFNIKDRIIISLTNKFFTEELDYQFYKHSYAFRAPQIINGTKVQLTHHNAIESIQSYRNEYKGKRLWVSECDISKFYDSVSHRKIKSILKKSVNNYQKATKSKFDSNAIRIFKEYLNCYSFVHNVVIYNNNKSKEYWEKFKINDGKFGWVENELNELQYYNTVRKNRIGVPQGGALSGFIANLILNEADQLLDSFSDKKLHYVRFCDDMVLIHPQKNKCKYYSELYKNKLNELLLIPHTYEVLDYKNKKEFWSDSIKSKAPYKWSNDIAKSFYWFGFVGYELSYHNEIRVRKRSLRKEKTKQRELVELTLKSLKKGKRKTDETIIESVNNRLIGMSVGRINMKNYSTSVANLCWTNGFKQLQDNSVLRKQLKLLDKNRGVQVSKLKKGLQVLPSKIKEPEIIIPLKLFTAIAGITILDSKNIINNLISLKILNSKQVLRKEIKEKISISRYKLGLNNPYDKLNDIIIEMLISYGRSDRNVEYYGKPYSYYYHICEK